MKRKTRIASLVLALILGAALMFAGSLVSHAETFFEEGDFRFAVSSGEKLLVAQYNGSDTAISLPDSVNGRAVTGIYSRCFENTAVESVVIPEGYTVIGSFAFSGCQSLTSVSLPSTLKSIGIMAFYDCALLSDIDFSAAEDLETISFAAFQNCYALEAAELPSAISTVGENAFCNCTSLATLTIPNTLRTVGSYAFYDCPLPEEFFLPETITSIGSNAFSPSNSVSCFAGTAAAEYCQSSGAENAVVVEKIIGDANCDGSVNVNDVTAIQRYLAELEDFAPYRMILADATADGRVSVDDATRIQMYLAEYDVTLG